MVLGANEHCTNQSELICTLPRQERVRVGAPGGLREVLELGRIPLHLHVVLFVAGMPTDESVSILFVPQLCAGAVRADDIGREDLELSKRLLRIGCHAPFGVAAAAQ